MPQTPARLLARMRSVSPSSPRLVWHGHEGRIELSGRVVDNWVAKSSNLLVDELDAERGTTVALDLPVHWKSLVLALACWQVGCTVVLPGDPTPGRTTDGPTEGVQEGTDIVLTSRTVPALEPPRLLVCVALGSLALAWGGPLPRGALDYAAEVRSHGDVYSGQGDDPGDARLVRAGDGAPTEEDLPALVASLREGFASGDTAAGTIPGTGNTPTLLLEPGTDLLHALAAALGVWERDGAIVLVEDGVPVTDRLLAGERVTDRWGTA